MIIHSLKQEKKSNTGTEPLEFFQSDKKNKKHINKKKLNLKIESDQSTNKQRDKLVYIYFFQNEVNFNKIINTIR